MRTSRLTVTTTIVLSLAGAAAATSETLELRIVSTNGAALVNVHANEAFVGVKIQGRLTGGTTAGLGMWMADVRNSGTAYVNMSDSGEFHVAAPTAVADHFGRTPGFDNPAWGSPPRAGYTGSASDDADVLAQIGGGQNTMGNASGAYPLGTVSLDVGNSGWTDLATGSVYFAGSLGDTVEELGARLRDHDQLSPVPGALPRDAGARGRGRRPDHSAYGRTARGLQRRTSR